MLWFFILIAVVWLSRATRAFASNRNLPRVIPHPWNTQNECDLITIIVPAKNEEKNIRECFERLNRQDYPEFEILIANDGSTDQTEAILKSLGIPEIDSEKTLHAGRVAYLNVPPTPAGWTGKNFALHAAIPYTRGKWLLFTDADTRHETHSLSSAFQHIKKNKLSFLTCLPQCLTESLLEHMLQPLDVSLQ